MSSKAFLSTGATRNPRPNIITKAQADTEARRILAETEPDTRGPGGVRNRHYPLDSMGYAGRNLAEALASFIAVEV